MDIVLRDLCDEDKVSYRKACGREFVEESPFSSDSVFNRIWEIIVRIGEKRVYAIANAETNQFYGFCEIEEYGETPEIGISLLPDCQGKGIGVKAIRKMIEIEKSNRKIKYFLARIDNKNIRSIRMFEKLNFVKLEGIQHKSVDELEKFAEDNPDVASVVNIVLQHHQESILNFALYV